MRYVLARLYDWSEATLATDDATAFVATDDPEVMARAHARIAEALTRTAW